MNALQFIIPKKQIKYKSANRNGQILILQGENFLEVDKIEINDQVITDYVKLSDNTIIIQLPNILSGVSITSIILLGRVVDLSTAVLVNELSDRIVSGPQKLIQRYIKYFLQSPNSNVFNSEGGGILKLIGQTNIDDDASIVSKLVDATNTAKNAVIREQANSSLPLSEKLLDVQIVDITLLAEDSIQIVKKLLNKAGQTTSFSLNI
jgi:hypothetical protein